MNTDDEKRIENLFKTLQKDSKSVLYAKTTISKNLLKKINKSTYQKDRVFNELYQKLEDKNFDKDNDKIPLKTPFFEKKKATLIDRLFTVLKDHFKEFMQILLI